MQTKDNPWRGQGLPEDVLAGAPMPSIDADTARRVVDQCLVAGETPLTPVTGFGPEVWVKDERGRMGMGSFKALGAAYVIAHDAMTARRETMGDDIFHALEGKTYATASAGNHGLSVAAGAQVFGATAVIFLAETVPESFANRLRGFGADVRRHGAIYEDAMAGAAEFAKTEGHVLLSDSSWPEYFERPYTLMEGYLTLMQEAVQQMSEPPSHIILQAGVGGLAAACAACSFSVNVGDDTFNFGDLPATRQEVALLADQIPGAQVLIDHDFTPDQFQGLLSRYSIIHLATHGLFVSGEIGRAHV